MPPHTIQLGLLVYRWVPDFIADGHRSVGKGTLSNDHLLTMETHYILGICGNQQNIYKKHFAFTNTHCETGASCCGLVAITMSIGTLHAYMTLYLRGSIGDFTRKVKLGQMVDYICELDCRWVLCVRGNRRFTTLRRKTYATKHESTIGSVFAGKHALLFISQRRPWLPDCHEAVC